MNRLRTMLAGVAVMLAGAPASAVTYSNLFVFGDSLVDAGNAQRATAGTSDPQASAAKGYVDGRFSNGENFADVVSRYITGGPTAPVLKPGVTITDPALITAADLEAGAHNFSVGGAQAAEVAGDRSPSLAEQIGIFSRSGQSFSPDSLVLLSVGGNDVRAELVKLATAAALGQSYTPDLTATATAVSTGLGSLIGLGARNIVLVDVPDIGDIPAVTGLNNPLAEQVATALSFGLDQTYAQIIAGAVTATGANVRQFSLFGLEAQLEANPAAFGLAGLNLTDPCQQADGSLANPTCSGYLYFDQIHPTTQIHAVIGNAIARQLGLVPEPAEWVMLIVGFGLVGVALRRRRPAVALA